MRLPVSATRVAIVALLVSSTLLLGSRPAHGQSRAQLALFKTAAEDADLGELASALDPVMLSSLGELTTVQISARPALDLPSMQLALDCVGETVDCLRAVAAQQAEADSLLAPSVRREGDALIVSLLHYQPGEGSPIRHVQRRYSGDRQGEQALAGIEGMLTELFPPPAELPPPAAEPATPQTSVPILPPPAAASEADRESASGVPVVPIILGSVGVALLGTSVALGLMAKASEDEYNDIVADDEPSADRALEKLNTAEAQATAANVTLGLGIGALVAGGVLLFWQLQESGGSEQHASVRPHVARGEVGLTLSGAWNDEL
jgi:hypothetical protein